MTELLAAATTAANSADVVITAGTKKSFFLKPATGKTKIPKTAALWMQKKTGGDYTDFFLMYDHKDHRAITIEATTADITVRGARGVQDEALGLDEE